MVVNGNKYADNSDLGILKLFYLNIFSCFYMLSKTITLLFFAGVILFFTALHSNEYYEVYQSRAEVVDNSPMIACARCSLAEGIRHNELDVVPPQIIRETPPYYPLEYHVFEGTVLLEITVLPDSTIGYIEIKESIPVLDSLAKQTVREWEFIPAYKEGEAVVGFLDVAVEFVADETILPDYEEDVFDENELDDLHQMIDDYVKAKREMSKHELLRLPYSTYNENYHLFSPSLTYPLITRNKFTLIPDHLKAFHVMQNLFPFFDFKTYPHKWEFRTEDYNIPVTLVESYMGLGYMNMDYAHIKLKNNNTFSIEGLQLISSYFTDDGYWMGSDEKNSNFMLDLFYPFGNYSFRWNMLTIDQSIPSTKLRYIDNQHFDIQPVENKLNEHMLYFNNPYLDIGLRYEKSIYKLEADKNDLDRSERELLQMNLNRSFFLSNHSFNMKWERLLSWNQDDKILTNLINKDNDIQTLTYIFDTDLLYLNAEILSGLEYKYRADSYLEYRFNNLLNWRVGAIESELHSIDNDNINFQESWFTTDNRFVHQIIESDIYSTITLNELNQGLFRSIILSLTAGKRKFVESESYVSSFETIDREQDSEKIFVTEISEVGTYYLKNDYSISLHMGNISWELYGFGKIYFDNDEMQFLPRLFSRSVLECKYHLRHNNIISIGFIHHYFSEYKPIHQYSTKTSILDSFARISITNLFDIQADIMNILETETLFGYPSRSGIHINAGIRWLFFN